MRFLPIASAFALVLGASTAGLAASSAMNASPNDKVLEYQGYQFACSGVGSQSQDAAVWERFPLKMVFTNKDGDFLANVSVTLMDQNGATVVKARCMAPWLLANVHPGQYSARVRAEGGDAKVLTFKVDAEGQTEVTVPFPEISGT